MPPIVRWPAEVSGPCADLLEAQVTARMECGDHWILYAQVSHGGLLDPAGSTAVHQRRSGAND